VRIIANLREPAGVAFLNGALYVSAISRILRFDDIERRLDSPPEPVVVSDAFPGEGHHGRKFIAFGPDGKLYVPVGAPCNICEPDPSKYTIITRMNADGSGREIVARGVRNSVGFDWHPQTKELWFTDNGRDMLGDDVPPDELDRVTRAAPELRLSVLPWRHDQRSRVRQHEAVQRIRAAGAEPGAARGGARRAFLYGHAIPA
jgi:glucose/arabinose dehydrogenase